MRGILSVGIAFLLWMSGTHADIFITEVAMKAKPDWVEIYNSGNQNVDISGYMLTDLDATDSPFALTSTMLAPNAYALIHWAEGTDETDEVGDLFPPNGYIDLYVNDEGLTGTDDQVVLHNGTHCIDAVIWSNHDNGGRNSELNDFNDLAPDGWNYPDVEDWTAYDSCAWTDTDDMLESESLARYIDGNGSYVDTDRKTDWYGAKNPTPGNQNDQILSVEEGISYQSLSFLLFQNHPNPFHEKTDIRFQIADVRLSVHATLTIYNILGQEVRILTDNSKKCGSSSVSWDGTDNRHHEVPSGVYLYRLDAGEFVQTKKLILMR